jgi:predicted P-loop ATPase/GTPase
MRHPAAKASRGCIRPTSPWQIAAEKIVEHLEQSRFVVMKKPALSGHSALGRGFEG